MALHKWPIGVAKLWDVGTGRNVASFEGDIFSNPILAVAFPPDGRKLAVGLTVRSTIARPLITKKPQGEGEIRIYELETKKIARTLGTKAGLVRALKFSRDGGTLLVGASDWLARTSEVKVWDLTRGDSKVIFENKRLPVTSFAFSRDAKLVAVGIGGQSDEVDLQTHAFKKVAGLKVVQIEQQKELPGFEDVRYPVSAVAISPDAKFLVSGGESLDKLRRVELNIWEISSGKVVRSIEGHDEWINTLTFSPNGKFLASAGSGEGVKVWDLQAILSNNVPRNTR